MMHVLFAPLTLHSTLLMLPSTDSFLFYVLTTSASALLLFLKSLPVSYRPGFYFPTPIHSMEVVGRNYCLFKYKLKCWPLHGTRFQ